MNNNSIIFALSANKIMAKQLSQMLSIPLGENKIENFEDGEVLVRTLSNVADKNVYIVQSTSMPSIQRIFEVLVFVDALKNARAREITLILPYYGYSRQDRVACSGEPITAKMVANLYQSVGIDKLITVDLHTPQIQGFFTCPVKEISTTEIFGDYLNKLFKEQNIKGKDVCVVSPDHGSAFRARDLGSLIADASIAIIDKRRPAPNKSEVISLIGDVKDKVCVIVDDIIDTCGTVNNAVEALKSHGAKQIYVCASHAVFSHLELSKDIKQIIVTDTIEKDYKGVKVLSVVPLIAKAIKEN